MKYKKKSLFEWSFPADFDKDKHSQQHSFKTTFNTLFVFSSFLL
jgi:hypothetical protein